MALNILYFTASWCLPCRTLAPIVDEAKQMHTDVSFTRIDVDGSSELVARYNIRSVPTLVFEKDGKIVTVRNGLIPKTELHRLIILNK